MKKLLTIIAALAVTASAAVAQNSTRIGSSHAVDFGGYAGWSQTTLWNGQFLVDVNASKLNLRARIGLGLDSVKDHVSPAGSANLQYLIPIVGNSLFLYPSVGANFEYYYDRFRVGPRTTVGLEYQLSEHIAMFAEGRYDYMFLNNNSSRVGGGVGMTFAFGQGKRGISRRAAEKAEAEALIAAQQQAEAKRAAAEEAVKANPTVMQVPTEERVEVRQGTRTVITETADQKARTYNLLFTTGTAYLDANVKFQIETIAALMAKYPEMTVSLKAYADKTRGDEESNKTLSDMRANAVQMYLRELGVDPSRISSESFGSSVNPFPTPVANRVVVLETKENNQ